MYKIFWRIVKYIVNLEIDIVKCTSIVVVYFNIQISNYIFKRGWFDLIFFFIYFTLYIVIISNSLLYNL